MHRFIRITAAFAALGFMAGAIASDGIDDGRVMVKAVKNNAFSTSAYVMGKAELFGYIGDLKDTKKITGIVLRNPDKATPEQKHVLAITAQAQHLEALVEDDGKLVALVDPLAAPAAPVAPAAAPAAALAPAATPETPAEPEAVADPASHPARR